MCGRFVGFRRLEELIKHFPIDVANINVTPNYNVAPRQEILVIVRQDKKPFGEVSLGACSFLGKGHKDRKPYDQCKI